MPVRFLEFSLVVRALEVSLTPSLQLAEMPLGAQEHEAFHQRRL